MLQKCTGYPSQLFLSCDRESSIPSHIWTEAVSFCRRRGGACEFFAATARIGYPHTKKQVLALVQEIVESKAIDTTVTNGWWERFCQRHPEITFRAAVPFSIARAMATDTDVLDRYFEMHEECLQKNKILNKPSCIFNCDESGMPLNPKCLKVVAEKGTKNPSYLTGGDKSQLTVLACTSAAGYALPP